MIRYKTILSFLLQPIRRAISRAISRRDWSLIFLDLIHGITASYSRGFEEAIKKFFSWWVPAFFKPDDNDLKVIFYNQQEYCYFSILFYFHSGKKHTWILDLCKRQHTQWLDNYGTLMTRVVTIKTSSIIVVRARAADQSSLTPKDAAKLLTANLPSMLLACSHSSISPSFKSNTFLSTWVFTSRQTWNISTEHFPR